MIPVLLDPWLLKFSSDVPDDQMHAKAGSMSYVFSSLKKHYPIEVLPFISEVEHAEFWECLKNYKGADAMDATRWINTLVLVEEPPEITEASILDTPCPVTTSSLWLRVLASIGKTDDPPRWRYPMVFIPSIRKPYWPNNDEINFTHQGLTITRNLISIEQSHTHKYFHADIDPWRLGCIGEPEADVRRQLSCPVGVN